MRSLTLIAMLAVSALVLTHCAPSSTRHSSTISKPAGGIANKQAGKVWDPVTKTWKVNPNAKPSPTPGSTTAGSCKTPTDAGDPDALLKPVTDAIQALRPITFETLAAGHYKLVNLTSNFEIKDTQSFEVVQRFNATVQGNGTILNCADNQFAGPTPTPPDNGREIMVERQFDIDANKKLARASSIDIRQIGAKDPSRQLDPSTNLVDQNSQPPAQLTGQPGLLTTIATSMAGASSPQYTIPLTDSRVQETVQIAQGPNNQIVVYVDILEGNSANYHRQFLLLYSVDTTAGAAPTP